MCKCAAFSHMKKLIVQQCITIHTRYSNYPKPIADVTTELINSYT